MKVGDNPLLFSNFEQKITQKSYFRNSDGLLVTDELDNFQSSAKEIILNVESNRIKKFLHNKTVVDAGSGLGKYLPLFSFYKPKEIISVEKDRELLDIQIEFSKSLFPFLPKKSICNNIEFYNEEIETFLTRQIQFDTICFFENWHYMDYKTILRNIDADVIFYTKLGIEHNIYDVLRSEKYAISEEIIFSAKLFQPEYFIIIAKKSLDNGDN